MCNCTLCVDKTMVFMNRFPGESTFSLARDILEGKPSEMDYQNGTVVQLGKQHGNSYTHQSIHLFMFVTY